MLKSVLVTGCVLAVTATGAFAQPVPREGGDRRDRPEIRRDQPPGTVDQRRRPPVVIQPQRPPVIVVRPTPRPVIVRPGPRRPIIAYAPPPPPPVWSRGAYPYEQRFHSDCQRKAWRLRWFERRAAADGVLTYRERLELQGLRRDVRRTCGGWRYRG